MVENGPNRRLAAILAADVVGYSRLMEADEAGTLARLKSRQKEVLTPLVAKHKGRLFKVTGDGVLVEFASAVNAVQCAVELQLGMAAANDGQPETRHIVLRIGVNLGDVMAEGGDLYGDGVNIAARLEGLAEPGGILVSGSAQEQVRNKVPVEFDDMGSRNLKNISSPVRAYRVSLSQKVSAPPLALPDKPSIAVLPFTNMSGDPEQEYFSDGITEDIITALTHFRSLFVIARNSSFSYKGRSVKVQDIGRDLGVAYIVEGSVRKAGSRVRVTAQLIEAQSGNHIWANKLDRELADIFDVQDELVRAIASAVPGRVAEADLERSHRKPSESLTAYDYLLRGEWLLLEDYGSEEGARFFEKAIEIDPRCARAYCRLATYHAYRMFGQGAFDEHTLRLTPSLANKALEIDPGDAFVQSIAAQGFGMLGHHELASSHFDRAVALNPNEATVMRNAPQVLSYLGRTEESLDWMVRYMRADPHYGGVAREAIFDCLYLAKRFEDAIAMFQGWREPPAHMFCELAAAYSHLGRMEEAKTAVTEFERRKPAGFDFGVYKNAQIRMCARAQEAELWREGYRKAGLL